MRRRIGRPYNCAFDSETVKEIRKLLKRETVKRVALKFRANARNIYRIKNRESYRGIK